MSEQAVNELSTATPNLTDYIMGMSGTAEYKALVSAVAKKIVEDYAGSSLAGSNQSVKAALDTLNSNMGLLENHSIYLESAGTKTMNLSLGQFLVTVGKLNEASTSNVGVYIITAHSTTSNVYAIKESGGATVTMSRLTMTLTATKTYMVASVTKLCANKNT